MGEEEGAAGGGAFLLHSPAASQGGGEEAREGPGDEAREGGWWWVCSRCGRRFDSATVDVPCRAPDLRDISETLPRHLQDTSETIPCRAPDPLVSIETYAALSEAEGVDGNYVCEGLGWESEIVKERLRLSLAPNEQAHLESIRVAPPGDASSSGGGSGGGRGGGGGGDDGVGGERGAGGGSGGGESAGWQGGGKWPLRLAPGGLLSWERELGEAVHNLLHQLLPGRGGEARRRRGGVHPTLRSIGGMIRATEAVLGGAHCVPMALRDMQLDHWLDTAAEVAESAGAAGPAEAAEAALLDALRDGGGVSFESALAFFGAAWEALAAQWAWHLRCGLLMLHESVGELLRALLEWRLDRAFLAADAARAEAVRAMVAASVERATIEYGAASDDTTELLGLWERVQTGRGAE